MEIREMVAKEKLTSAHDQLSMFGRAAKVLFLNNIKFNLIFRCAQEIK